RTDHAQLLGQYREHEVGMGFGQVELLLDAVAQSDTEPFATTEGDQRLGKLVAGAVGVVPGIEEAGQALEAVRFEQHQQCRHAAQRAEQQDEAEQPDTPEEQHAGGGTHEDHGGAEVRFDDQQPGHGTEHQEGLDEAEPFLFDLVPAVHQIAGQEHHGKQLGQFGRLHVHRADRDPAPAAVDLPADARDQHQDQQGKTEEQQREAELLPQPQRDSQGAEQRDDADHHIHQLALHVIQRAAQLTGGHFHGGGADHHQPQRQQRQTGDQQRQVHVEPALAYQRGEGALQSVGKDHDNLLTAAANRRPRSSKLANMSRLAQAG